ncbi:MAG TPA: helix-turn-helix transcriptional regulator [Daejeonella sp.]|nr:helix-turn-helix transcriptional regulator [Daejeonella sp.]
MGQRALNEEMNFIEILKVSKLESCFGRPEKNLTQAELAEIVDKKREYISRIENNGSNLTLKTLFDIVEKGLGGKVKISIEV